MRRKHAHVSIDYYAYCSKLREFNSSCKVLFAIGSIFAVIAADQIGVSFVTMLFMLVLTVVRGRTPMVEYLKLLTIPLAFILCSGTAIMIEPGKAATAIGTYTLWKFTFSVTEKSILLAVKTSMKAIGGISALYMLSLSTPMGEIMNFFRKFHVPDLFIELMHLIYRYIFILSDINHRQKDAAMSRLGYNGYKNSIRTFGNEMANLFLMSMKKAGTYYDAMEARGYDGKYVFYQEQKKITVEQILWIGSYIFLLWIMWR